jgi:hypothetical protein
MTVSPVAQHVLVTVLSLTTPLEWQAVSVSPQPVMLPSPRRRGLGLQSYIFSRPPLGSRALRPGDLLTVLTTALSIGFIRFVSSADATQATELLTLSLVGLAPTEHVCLSWTHSFAIIASGTKSLTRA